MYVNMMKNHLAMQVIANVLRSKNISKNFLKINGGLAILNTTSRSLSSIMSGNVKKVTPSQIKSGKADFPLISALAPPTVNTHSSKAGDFPKKFTEEELKKKLTDEEYRITQRAGTERAFTGRYWDNHRKGIYKCVVCEEDLFSSDTKFESGSGWPSFYEVLEKGKVKLVEDTSLFMKRVEVLCAQCGAHLGHVFEDGPNPTGQRYCMNSASLKFKESGSKSEL